MLKQLNAAHELYIVTTKQVHSMCIFFAPALVAVLWPLMWNNLPGAVHGGPTTQCCTPSAAA